MDESIWDARLWVSVFSAIVAVSAVLVTLIIYWSANDPNVIVYAEDDPRRPTIILLVIENIGRGSAKNITFAPNRPLPQGAWGFENAKMPQQMIEGPIITGIPYLRPGARRVISWGQYYGLKKWFENSTISIDIFYERDGSIPIIRNRRIKTTSILEIMSFAGTDASDSNWDRKIAQELKTLNDRMKALIDAINSKTS